MRPIGNQSVSGWCHFFYSHSAVRISEHQELRWNVKVCEKVVFWVRIVRPVGCHTKAPVSDKLSTATFWNEIKLFNLCMHVWETPRGARPDVLFLILFKVHHSSYQECPLSQSSSNSSSSPFSSSSSDTIIWSDLPYLPHPHPYPWRQIFFTVEQPVDHSEADCGTFQEIVQTSWGGKS